jgi:Ca2+-binding RTX toxin-like protein
MSRRSAVLLAAAALLVVPAVAAAASLTGTSGADTLTGTTSADTITGLAGHDTIIGNGGADRIDAGSGFDFASDGSGSTILGGAGDDLISTTGRMGGGGHATVDCGTGNDFVFSNEYGFAETAVTTNCEEVYAWQYGSHPWGTSGYRNSGPRPDSTLMRGTNDADRLMGLGRPENMVGGPGNDMLFGNVKPDSTGGDLLLGGAGDDLLDTGDNRGPRTVDNVVVAVRGGSGNDIIIARAADMDIDCGPGYDIVYVAGNVRTPSTSFRNCEETPSMA